MKNKNINWLGWAFFVLLTIVSLMGMPIEIYHTFESSPYDALRIKHEISGGQGSSVKVDVINHPRTY